MLFIILKVKTNLLIVLKILGVESVYHYSCLSFLILNTEKGKEDDDDDDWAHAHLVLDHPLDCNVFNLHFKNPDQTIKRVE